jgi:hypothetical protein
MLLIAAAPRRRRILPMLEAPATGGRWPGWARRFGSVRRLVSTALRNLPAGWRLATRE